MVPLVSLGTTLSGMGPYQLAAAPTLKAPLEDQAHSPPLIMSRFMPALRANNVVLHPGAGEAEEHLQVLQVLCVNEDLSPGGALHGELDEVCGGRRHHPLVAQEAPALRAKDRP